MWLINFKDKFYSDVPGDTILVGEIFVLRHYI